MRLKKYLCLILAIINILVVSIGSYLYFNNQLLTFDNSVDIIKEE